MKRILYFACFIAATVLYSSCEDDLDTTNYTMADATNYPTTAGQASSVLAGVYNILNTGQASPEKSFFLAAKLASDDQLGGASRVDYHYQALDLLSAAGANLDQFNDFWANRYEGIYRANYAIETFGDCTGYSSDDEKNQMLGEAYFLRGYYYYELASFFENVPLITSTSVGKADVPQAKPSETWGQIMSDFKTAIELMPAKPFGSAGLEDGHVDKWTAEAMMARAYLFYTGFYETNEVVFSDGSKLTKESVINWVNDCVENSGYSLVPDFRNLWAYTNRCTKEDYKYTKGLGLDWVEDDVEVNPESMFSIKFSEFAAGGSSKGFANRIAYAVGLRGGKAKNNFPFAKGKGAGTVSSHLWTDWKAFEKSSNGGKKDMRRKASICYIPEELPKYKNTMSFVQRTDYLEKKLVPISAVKDASKKTYWATFESLMYPNNWTQSINSTTTGTIHDLVLLRFADVLLMQSELLESVEGINKVRARAGLKLLDAYSLSALQDERRFELCFEGVRWNDIRRWHIAETVLDKQLGQPIYVDADKTTNEAQNGGYAARYQATKGFFSIPTTQIGLSEKLVQNKGWESGYTYYGW